MTTACDDILRRFAEEEIGRHDERAAFEAGKKVAFIAAVEECQAYHRSLLLEEGACPTGVLTRTLAKGEAAQQIAMRIAQRAKRGEK